MNSICNCDSHGVKVDDKGLLNNKNSLPVKALQYGAFTTLSSIQYNLGPLICSGKTNHYPSEKENIQFTSILKQLQIFAKRLDALQENDRSDDLQHTKIAFRATKAGTKVGTRGNFHKIYSKLLIALLSRMESH